MANEIKLNIELINSNIDKLRSSVDHLESNINGNESFQGTNIKPFIEDLENLIKAIELLNKYKAMFYDDLIGMEKVAEELRQQDEKLARSTKGKIDTISNGYKPIRV